VRPISENPIAVLPWELSGSTVSLRYATGSTTFIERLEFDTAFDLTPMRRNLLDMLALVAVVSYAKAFAPTEIDASHFSLPQPSKEMIGALYDHGMREFAAHNSLPRTPTFTFSGTSTRDIEKSTPRPHSSTPLIPMGGGRDSSVVATALSALNPVLLSIGHNRYVEDIANRLSLPLHTATRHIDEQLLTLNTQGAYNGHVPVTAINSLIALLAADVYACDCVVMANEKSSSEPTRVIDGYSINHQYSKSHDFESLLRSALFASSIGIDYFSALRDRNDEEIARTFAQSCAPLHTAFMSCNNAMLRDPNRRSRSWCGNCPKCRSVFLTLAPHLSPQQLTEIFGKDLLDDATQIPGFTELLDVDAKPYECVGEIASARVALSVLQTKREWKEHRVVVAIGAISPTAQSSATDQSTHFIPDNIHQLMDKLFSP
jgi:UDP-N-acetyl-alpha-D-muramoyl-L-alanyl-L-glutamate epimerase